MRTLPHPSPNRGPRRDGARPSLVVLHYTAMATPEAALDRLCDPAAEVSAHYLIARDGTVFALVPDDERAWHAGAGAWGAITDINSHSIGIELDNPGDAPFAAPLMASLEALLAALLARHRIPPSRVIAHSDCAPSRKCDPGPRFDWRRLARSGLAVWPDLGSAGRAGAAVQTEAPHGALADHLRRIGYTAEATPLQHLAAFRLRFRPGAEGPPDAGDAALAVALAARHPVDGQGTVA